MFKCWLRFLQKTIGHRLVLQSMKLGSNCNMVKCCDFHHSHNTQPFFIEHNKLNYVHQHSHIYSIYSKCQLSKASLYIWNWLSLKMVKHNFISCSNHGTNVSYVSMHKISKRHSQIHTFKKYIQTCSEEARVTNNLSF